LGTHRIRYPGCSRPRRRGLVSGANGVRTSRIPCRANRKRIGTAELGNRDERHPLPAIGPKLAVSGPASAVPLSPRPRESAAFSRMLTVSGRKVSATADYLAVGAVGSEPVSAAGIPDLQGKYREFFKIRALPAEDGLGIPRLAAGLATNSLRPRTGNPLPRTGNRTRR